jgi:phenylpropionate dioxygenase-like ring-hydroxylating dioxygenase large terminal subunit
MNTWSPALQRSWFVVARSRELGERPLAVTLLDRPIVLARLGTGELAALDDSCPHRQAPLSAGRLTNDGVQCAYHGWTFGADGRCTSLPGLAQPACGPAARVAAMQVFEHDGLVWVSPAARGLSEGPSQGLSRSPAGPDALPAFVRQPRAGSCRFTWSTTWNARALDALENFLDPLHTHFVHPGLVRRDGDRQAVTATVVRSNGTMRIDYSGQPKQNGLLFQLFESRRDVERAHFSTAAAGSAQLEYRYANGSALYFTLHFSPQSENQTRVHGTFHVEGRWAPTWAVRLFAWPFLRHVARQDQRIVEAQCRNRARFQRSGGMSTELDLARPGLDEVWSPAGSPSGEATRTITILL